LLLEGIIFDYSKDTVIMVYVNITLVIVLYRIGIVCLHDYVGLINSDSIGIFENRLDLFWKSQECYYDNKSDIAGTGSRSQL
jgi:hypothetical protein